MKLFSCLLFILFPLGLFAQEFRQLAIKDGEIKGITYLTRGTERTARPVIWVHGIQETAERWREFMKAHPEINHFAINLPTHGVGDDISLLKGKNNYKRFYEEVLPSIIDHVQAVTGQRPLLVGYSLGAKTVHDALTKVPGLSDKVEGVVELMRPNQLGRNVPIPRSILRAPKAVFGVVKDTPTIPDNQYVKKAVAKIFPALPNGVYTHLEGTEMGQLENLVMNGQSTQVGNELNADLIDDINSEFVHSDHGKPMWYVWADNDFICPGGADAFEQMVRIRAQDYVAKNPQFNVPQVSQMIRERNFPPGMKPIYGTSMGDIGHLGGVIPGSESAKVLSKGIGSLVKDPSKMEVPAKVRFKISKFNGIIGAIRCTKADIFGALNSLFTR